MGHHSLWCCTNPENLNYKWEMNLARATKVKRRQGEKWGNKWASDYFLYMKWLKLILYSYKCSHINCIYVVISDFLSKCFYTHINTFILFYFLSIRLAPLHIHSNTGVILVFSLAQGHFLSRGTHPEPQPPPLSSPLGCPNADEHHFSLHHWPNSQPVRFCSPLQTKTCHFKRAVYL